MTALHRLNMETLKALSHINSLRTYAQGAGGGKWKKQILKGPHYEKYFWYFCRGEVVKR